MLHIDDMQYIDNAVYTGYVLSFKSASDDIVLSVIMLDSFLLHC
jgi:hypothetical protein